MKLYECNIMVDCLWLSFHSEVSRRVYRLHISLQHMTRDRQRKETNLDGT